MRHQGANVLVYPSAFTVPTGKAGHWHTLLTARALDTGCFVLAPAQVGSHTSTRMSYGAALAVDPWGKCIGQCPTYAEWDRAHQIVSEKIKMVYVPHHSACFMLVEIDHAVTQEVRTRLPLVQHERFDLYPGFPCPKESSQESDQETLGI